MSLWCSAFLIYIHSLNASSSQIQWYIFTVARTHPIRKLSWLHHAQSWFIWNYFHTLRCFCISPPIRWIVFLGNSELMPCRCIHSVVVLLSKRFLPSTSDFPTSSRLLKLKRWMFAKISIKKPKRISWFFSCWFFHSWFIQKLLELITHNHISVTTIIRINESFDIISRKKILATGSSGFFSFVVWCKSLRLKWLTIQCTALTHRYYTIQLFYWAQYSMSTTWP